MSRKGENRADPLAKLGISLKKLQSVVRNETFQFSGPCIFISYKTEDEAACERIAQYIEDAGFDYYFAKHDKTLSELVQEGNPDKVTTRIQEGIDLSSHMICVVSVRTVSSYWVPFEVGYGCKTGIPLGVLTLRGLSADSLPDYMRTTRVIRGTNSLNRFIAELLGSSTERLVETKALKRHSEANHPLDEVLDWRE